MARRKKYSRPKSCTFQIEEWQDILFKNLNVSLSDFLRQKVRELCSLHPDAISPADISSVLSFHRQEIERHQADVIAIESLVEKYRARKAAVERSETDERELFTKSMKRFKIHSGGDIRRILPENDEDGNFAKICQDLIEGTPGIRDLNHLFALVKRYSSPETATDQRTGESA